jgi:hypothetical protein
LLLDEEQPADACAVAEDVGEQCEDECQNVFEKINRLLRRCVVAGGSRALCGRCGG